MGTTRNPANRFERHRKKMIAAMIVLILLIAEVALRVLAGYGLVDYKRYRTDHNPKFWADINEVWGTWHYPDAEFVHKMPCFEATYRSNSYGARDIERSLESDAERRVVVLGDSFIEGFGVNAEDRMTDIVEAHTGVEQLNFATSGTFGSIQEWLLYEGLASRFDHSDVFIFLLPANDFRDNARARHSPTRFRPYLRKKDGRFEVYYTVKFEDRDCGAFYPWHRVLKHHIYNNVYLVNVTKQTLKRINADSDSEQGEPWKVAYKYNSISKNDAEILFYTYDQIRAVAEDRQITIFIIPRHGDFRAYYEQGYDFKVVKALQEYAESRAGVEVHDLMPFFTQYAEEAGIHYDKFFLSCDGHWSPLGNRVAAMAVMKYVYGFDLAGR